MLLSPFLEDIIVHMFSFHLQTSSTAVMHSLHLLKYHPIFCYSKLPFQLLGICFLNPCWARKTNPTYPEFCSRWSVTQDSGPGQPRPPAHLQQGKHISVQYLTHCNSTTQKLQNRISKQSWPMLANVSYSYPKEETLLDSKLIKILLPRALHHKQGSLN